MASKPGILTDWPWKPLGSFKYLLLAPWVVESFYSFIITKDANERDLANFLVLPLLLWRMLHNQLWISLSRYRTAKGNNRIIDKGIEFEQVDRERNWDDQIILYGLVSYVINKTPQGSHLPIWRTDGVVMTILLHTGPVEFIYYWLHRALHHHFLYSRYHSHHHSSIVTEPITSVTHPFAEHLAYSLLFTSTVLICIFTHTASIIGVVGYITYIDFMNNMGHCNFELVPKCLFTIFPPLKYLMYTPSFHSLHHTQFRTNYCLFMPWCDYIYGTIDGSYESLYEKSLQRPEETPDVVHLTHLTTPESVYHLRLGLPFLASKPYSSSCYMWLLWPLTLWSMMVTWFYGYNMTFVVERNHFGKLRLQTWAILKYKLQYDLKQQNKAINTLIEKAITEADAKGVKVISLGLLNQGEELNGYGGTYLQKYPHLRVKLVDGSSLAVSVVLNTIPKRASQVVLAGNLSKVAYALAFSLCQRDIKVNVWREDQFEKLKKSFGSKCSSNLILSRSCFTSKIWVVGDGLKRDEQSRATEGSIFIPFSQFPPEKLRKDCFYHTTPALTAPPSVENVDSCENWLPRRVMSAWRVAGMVHGMEGWEDHECGYNMLNIDKIWEATIRHGFRPLNINSHFLTNY